ncbi:MAG: hypothetical protein ACOC9W_01630, partial [Persicimonas sp.]
VSLSFVASFFVEPSTALAQETETNPSADEQRTAASGEVAEAEKTEASANVEAEKSEATEPEKTEPAQNEPAQNEPAQKGNVARSLMAEHRLSQEQVDDLQELQHLESQVAAQLAGLRAESDRVDRRVTAAESSAVVLDEQVDDDTLSQEVRASLARKAAVAHGLLATRRASAEGVGQLVDGKRSLLNLLSTRVDELHRDAEKAAERNREDRARLDQATAAEQSALAEAERARVREARERDAQVREIIAQRRELLEKTAEVARTQSEQIQQASRDRTDRVETFASRREDIAGKLDSFPSTPSDGFAREHIDPVFLQVLEHRREVRRSVRRYEELYDAAKEHVSDAREKLADAEARHERARERQEELGESVVGEQKVKLAEARRELRDREVEAGLDIAQARREQLELEHERREYYDEVVEELLPVISDERRDEFYAVFNDENWESAWFGVRQAIVGAVEIGQMRADQFMALPERLLSAEAWGWLLVLFIRLGVLGLVVYFGRAYTDPAIRRLTSFALRRRFFKRYAPLTIKGAEVLRSVVPPIILYLLLDSVAAYLAEAFPELVIVSWGIDAFFVFWIAMTLVKVLVLPRRFREESLRTPAPDLSRLGADPMRASMSSVDLINLELSRARKLVRSLRIVLVFWLLEHYVPLAVTTLFGHSVVSKLVETIFWWGLALVVYLVLSTWKDDIAALFERLASERMPRAVEFVKTHKDRLYGVFVIALAFLYVAFREIGKFAGTQARDTEWSKRLSNFVFRKRIELQQKERDGEPVSQQRERAELPEDYAAYFDGRPLDDENYKVERDEQILPVLDTVARWQANQVQGSLALSAEQGLGRTSLVNDIVRRLAEQFPDLTVERARITDKIVDRVAIIKFIADFFGLDETPDGREQLVEQLLAMKPRMIVLDDCHHFFVREIGGFQGLDTFLEVVNLTDEVHFWMLTFNEYSWNYINRVHPRQHYFGKVCEIQPWSEREIQELIQRRNALTGRKISFTDLVITHDDTENDFYEIIKTANGYFRLLHEYSRGNPAVALRFWRRSIGVDPDGTIHVSLFRKPPMGPIHQLEDQYLFVLAAIAQHGALGPDELAKITNSEHAFCEMALNYFVERGIVTPYKNGRVELSPLYFRQIVKQLTASNFLWD